MQEKIKEILIWIAVFAIMHSFSDLLTDLSETNHCFLFGAVAAIISISLTREK